MKGVSHQTVTLGRLKTYVVVRYALSQLLKQNFIRCSFQVPDSSVDLIQVLKIC